MHTMACGPGSSDEEDLNNNEPEMIDTCGTVK